MIKFFLFDEKQVIGDDKLEIFNHGYIKGELTDYAKDTCVNARNENDKEYADWWLKKTENKIFASIINSIEETKYSVSSTFNHIGLRPALFFNDIKAFANNIQIINEHVTKFEFGYYPQDHTPIEEQPVLDTKYLIGSLVDEGNDIYRDEDKLISKAHSGNIWSIVEPITWILDNKTGIAIAEKILDGGNKNYLKILEFLNNEFYNKVCSKDNIIEFKLINELQSLKNKKLELEEQINRLNNNIILLKKNK